MKKLLHERLREVASSRIQCEIVFSEMEAGFQKEFFKKLADEIERYYIPRPRFEDGGPVQFGDEYVCNNGTVQIVKTIGKGWSGNLYVNPDSIEGYLVCLYENEYVKRPPKILDADGVEIKVGDTVYEVSTGISYEVTLFGKYDLDRVCLRNDGGQHWVATHGVTHKEPDSFEKIRDDMAQVTEQKDVDYGDMEAWIDRLSALIEKGE